MLLDTQTIIHLFPSYCTVHENLMFDIVLLIVKKETLPLCFFFHRRNFAKKKSPNCFGKFFSDKSFQKKDLHESEEREFSSPLKAYSSWSESYLKSRDANGFRG